MVSGLACGLWAVLCYMPLPLPFHSLLEAHWRIHRELTVGWVGSVMGPKFLFSVGWSGSWVSMLGRFDWVWVGLAHRSTSSPGSGSGRVSYLVG